MLSCSLAVATALAPLLSFSGLDRRASRAARSPAAAPAVLAGLVGLWGLFPEAASAQGQLTAPAPRVTVPEYSPEPGQPGKDVIWVPTPQSLVDTMLDLAGVVRDDFLIDLGSGDGRTVITAAERGARAKGIEYNADMVRLSQRNARAAGVEGRVSFVEGDIFATDFTEATVVSLFLLPELNLKLRPVLLEMRPGTRIVSNTFDMAEWKADGGSDGEKACTQWCRAWLWIVPARVDGHWRLGDSTLELEQTFQMLEGRVIQKGKAMPISDARMRGNEIRFTVAGKRYSGRVEGRAMTGSTEDGASWTARRSAG